MNRLFSLSLLLILLTGCASQASKEADILIHGIENQDLAVLENNKDNPYITTTKNVEPGFVEYSNAMEAAIYNRNLDAVKYLSSIDAAHKVSVRFNALTGQWQRTEVNIPPAELACGVADFETMAFLLERYPDEKPNYTNCLHYLVASLSYYPSGHFFILKNPAPTFRNGENTAVAVQKIIDLGGEPNTQPEYGVPMYNSVLSSNTNDLLVTLLKNGMDANTQFSCLYGKCMFLTKLGNYLDETQSSERAKILVKYGADVNATHDTPVIIGLDASGSYLYEKRSMTPLHDAEFFDKKILAATLIDLGADPAHKNADGYTADGYAGKFAKIKALYEKQVAINQQRAAQAQKNKDSGGSFGGSILDVMGAIGAGGLY
jgi:ankyrin repeat protein